MRTPRSVNRCAYARVPRNPDRSGPAKRRRAWYGERPLIATGPSVVCERTSSPADSRRIAEAVVRGAASGLAACVKYLGDDVPSGQIIFVRGVISVVVLALSRGGPKACVSPNGKLASRTRYAHCRERPACSAGSRVDVDPIRGFHGDQLHGPDVPDGARDDDSSASESTAIVGSRSRSASSAC